MLKLTPKIEAAAEQSPWISQIQKHIQRIESQLAQTTEQLREDAKRLGITEERLRSPPGRSTHGSHARPVATSDQSTLRTGSGRAHLHDAHEASQATKRSGQEEADRLAKELAGALATREHDNLHDAMTATSELIGLLRRRLQIQESLDKHNARRQQLEEEAVDLAADEALPSNARS